MGNPFEMPTTPDSSSEGDAGQRIMKAVSGKEFTSYEELEQYLENAKVFGSEDDFINMTPQELEQGLGHQIDLSVMIGGKKTDIVITYDDRGKQRPIFKDVVVQP